MVRARWQATIADEAGNILPGASIEVRREEVGAPLAVLSADRDGGVLLGNPFNADPDGFAAFHAAGGAHKITATLGAFSRTWRYVGVGTASEMDARPLEWVSPLDLEFGAKGDGIANDTEALQAAFDAAIDRRVPLLGMGKTYAVTNLAIKNRNNGNSHFPVGWFYGQGATIKKISGGNDIYLVAPDRWIENSQFGNYPVLLQDWCLDGNNIATHTLVWRGFSVRIENNEIRGGLATGLFLPSLGIDGVTETTSSNNQLRIIGNRVRNNVGIGIHVPPGASNRSDSKIFYNHLAENNMNLNLQGGSGWCFIGNHSTLLNPGSSATAAAFISEGFAVCAGNVWDSGLAGVYALHLRSLFRPTNIVDDIFQNEHPTPVGKGLLVEFVSGSKTVRVQGCTFLGAQCGIEHGSNDSAFELISKDNTFGAGVLAPYTMAGGGSRMTIEGDRRDNGTDTTVELIGNTSKTLERETRTAMTTTTLTAARTWTLRSAAAVREGAIITVADKSGAINGTNTLTVAAAAGDSINGAATRVLSTARASAQLMSDGVSQWTVV